MKFLVGIILVILIGAGIYYFAVRTENLPVSEEIGEGVVGEDKNGSFIIAGTVSPLFDFNKSEYEKAIAGDKLVVLYFYANWCPICKRETSEALYPVFNELTTDEVVGFRVNYNDNETDEDERALAREFGVAYQHTKVFLRNGERLLKSPESWDKDRYLSEINQALAN